MAFELEFALEFAGLLELPKATLLGVVCDLVLGFGGLLQLFNAALFEAVSDPLPSTKAFFIVVVAVDLREKTFSVFSDASVMLPAFDLSLAGAFWAVFPFTAAKDLRFCGFAASELENSSSPTIKARGLFKEDRGPCSKDSSATTP